MGFHCRHGPCHVSQHGAPARFAGVAATAVLIEHKFIRRFFRHAYQSQRRLFSISFFHIASLIEKAGEMDALFLQVSSRQ